MKIRSKRPGPLVIADAKLRLRPGEVVEVKALSPQGEGALGRGFIEQVAEDTPVGPPDAPKGTPPATRLAESTTVTQWLLAGPFPAIDSREPGPAGFSGSLIVAEFASLDEARAWAGADPYIEAGVYRETTVKPFLKALP